MSARYLRQVPDGEPFDPTMTGVSDLRVFSPGDVLRSSGGYSLITAIDQYDARTLLAYLLPISTPPDGARIHDLRDNDVRNLWRNGVTSDGKAPCEVMSFEEARVLYAQAFQD